MSEREMKIDPFDCPESSEAEEPSEVRESVRKALASRPRDTVQAKPESPKVKIMPTQAPLNTGGVRIDPFESV